MHAELRIGDSIVMISDASERAKATSAMVHVYVPNVDAVYQKALKAGGTSVMEPADMFYGDRSGGVTDPAGNQWHIGTHVEDVSPAELQKRAAEFLKQQHKAA
jgi:PhnB protein